MTSKETHCTIVAFGDVHAHPWQDGERPDRWKDCVKAIDLVYDVANAEKADMIVFCGDLFESKRAIRTDIAAAVAEQIHDASKYFCAGATATPRHVIYLAGNHDMYRDSCVLRMLGEPVRVIEGQAQEILYPKRGHFLFAPHGTNWANVVEKDYDAVFTHQEFKGAELRPGILTQDDNVPEWVRARSRIVINGHYHIPQTLVHKGKGKLADVLCLGSPLQHNWKDVDDPLLRGCWIIELSCGGKAARYKDVHVLGGFDEFPRFFSSDEGAREQDFVRKIGKAVTIQDTSVRGDGGDVVASTKPELSIPAYVAHKFDGEEGTEKTEQRLTGVGLQLLGVEENE